MLTADDLRQKYLDFFVARGHKIIPSAPLVPENDPSVLYTTAGMHPLVPYLLGQPHPLGKRLVSVQKCVRTDDIDEVGDTFHHTFFEMLGNWSLGDYFKKEAITWSYEFLTKELKLGPDRLSITCFAGDADSPKDEESAEIWHSLGIPRDRIYFFDKKDNWWGPAGVTGPCGPDTEMHYDATQKSCGSDCKPNCSCGRFCEIWNDVFMQYNKTTNGKFEKLPKPNVDTGMGVERTLAIVNGFTDDYLTELWQPVIKYLEKSLEVTYQKHPADLRIIADHIRAAVFIITDGIQPSNKERGYILRRLIRRAILKIKLLEKDTLPVIIKTAEIFSDIMSPVYPEVVTSLDNVKQILTEETSRFLKTLNNGLKEFGKLENISGKVAFDLFQTYGFPWEITVELAQQKGITVDKSQFEAEFKKHKELSRTASVGMFKGGLQDQSEVTTRYHTATHLLHKALREVLGDHVSQKGSNITAERLRFDLSNDTKLTPEQISEVENIVNQKISENLVVTREEMPKSQALSEGALAFFPEKYPEITSVYTVGPLDNWYSRELCGGPHVSSTGEIGRINIVKEESAGAGIRRIYARLVPNT